MENILFEYCKFCKNKTATLQSYMNGIKIYLCDVCKYTFVVYPKDKENESMSKRRKRKKMKYNFVQNQKKIETTMSSTVDVSDSWEVEINCVDECQKHQNQ